MIGTYGAFADTTDVTDEYATMLIAENTEEYISETRIIEGVVKSVSDEQIELDDIVLNIGEQTLVADSSLIPTEVEIGESVDYGDDDIAHIMNGVNDFDIDSDSMGEYGYKDQVVDNDEFIDVEEESDDYGDFFDGSDSEFDN